MTKILLIDDDPDLCVLVRTILEKADFEVQVAYSGKEGVPLVREFRPDLVLLDIMIPGESGWDICEQLRVGETPIIFLSARGGESDVVRGLRLGADDYVPKPFRRHELIARIEAVLRRSRRTAPAEDAMCRVGDLTIDPSLVEVRRGGTPIPLTPTEYDLLLLLARNAGKPVPHRRLLTTVWGPHRADNLNILKVYIRQLRTKIEPDPSQPIYLLTRRGVGYYLADAT